MSKLTETKVDLTWEGFFGIFGDIFTAVGQLLVQTWIVNLWEHAERRETKPIPSNIKKEIEDKINDLKMNKMDEYNKNKAVYDDLLFILNDDCVRYTVFKDWPSEINWPSDEGFKLYNNDKIQFVERTWSIFFEIVNSVLIRSLEELSIYEATITLGHPKRDHYNILFQSSVEPSSTDYIYLWIHELVHVYQYRKLKFGLFTWKFGREFFKNFGNRDELELEYEANQIACDLGDSSFCDRL